MEHVGWKWLIIGGWEVDKVMYHLEWEIRDQRAIRDSEALRPEVRRFSLFFVSFFGWFFLGGEGGVGLSRVLRHVEDYGRCRMDRSWLWDFLSYQETCMYEIWLYNCSWNGWVFSTTRLPKYVIYLLPSFLLWVSYSYSWFLAETLKYLYPLFDDTNSFKLDEWVIWYGSSSLIFNMTLNVKSLW